MEDYLSASELASLIGCKPTSIACMRRWLDKNGWPYVENIRGFPKVWRKYHDAQMSGYVSEGKASVRIEPNFEALKKS